MLLPLPEAPLPRYRRNGGMGVSLNSSADVGTVEGRGGSGFVGAPAVGAGGAVAGFVGAAGAVRRL